MPTCVECGRPVTTLYTEYSKGNMRLTPCDNCHQFADKYIEHDSVLLFVDLLLHKPQVYRHLLFNRLEYREHGMDTNVLKMGILLVLFDVCIAKTNVIMHFAWPCACVDVKYVRLEKYGGISTTQESEEPPFLQYVFILSLCLMEFFAYHIFIRLAVAWYLRGRYAIIKFNYISMALILSSFAKLLLILMIIWDFYELEYSWLVNVLVFTSNAEALSVFLDLSYANTLAIIFTGIGMRGILQLGIHWMEPSIPVWVF